MPATPRAESQLGVERAVIRRRIILSPSSKPSSSNIPCPTPSAVFGIPLHCQTCRQPTQEPREVAEPAARASSCGACSSRSRWGRTRSTGRASQTCRERPKRLSPCRRKRTAMGLHRRQAAAGPEPGRELAFLASWCVRVTGCGQTSKQSGATERVCVRPATAGCVSASGEVLC